MIRIYFYNRVLLIAKPTENKTKPSNNILIYDYRNSLKDFILNFDASEEKNIALIESDDPQKILRKIIADFKFIEAAGGLVKNQNKQVLVIERLGVWDLPKGKMEKGEKPLESAIREIEEECGISGIQQVKKLQPTYHTYRLKGKFILKKTYWFEFSYSGTEKPKPQSEEDITKAEFIEKSQIPQVLKNTYPSIVDVFAEVFPEVSARKGYLL
ncbi:MAG: NUDIX domain-containing protein [Bacteroidota bacterium]|nr:NUDIX domain-containing protein [Bacteroidota bacterium]